MDQFGRVKVTDRTRTPRGASDLKLKGRNPHEDISARYCETRQGKEEEAGKKSNKEEPGKIEKIGRLFIHPPVYIGNNARRRRRLRLDWYELTSTLNYEYKY
jgi:hypothetical protein